MFRVVKILVLIFMTSNILEGQNKMVLLKEKQSIEINLTGSSINSDSFTLEFFEYIECANLNSTTIPFLWTNKKNESSSTLFFGIEIKENLVRIIFNDTIIFESQINADDFSEKWNHWAVIRDNDKINIALNGETITTKDIYYTFNFEMFEFGNVNNPNVKLGIDEIRIWNRNQSKKQLYNNMFRVLDANENGLETYFTLDEGTGNTLIDVTANGRNVILGGELNVTDWRDSGSFTYLLNKNNLSEKENWYNDVPGKMSNNIGIYLNDTVKFNNNIDVFNIIVGEETTVSFQENSGIFIQNSSNIYGEIILCENSFFIDDNNINDSITVLFEPAPTSTLEFWSIPIGNNSITPNDIWDFGNSSTQRDESWIYTFSNSWNKLNKEAILNSALGLSIKTSYYDTPANQTIYKGIPNNSKFTYHNQNNQDSWVLLGNPYPAYLNMEEFIAQNLEAFSGCIYPMNSVDLNENEDFFGEKIINLSGMVSYSKNDNLSSKQLGIGKTFLVNVKSDKEIVFNNSMKSPSRNSSNSTDRKFWISIEDNFNNYRQVLIADNDNASDSNDFGYDAEIYKDNEFSFYTICDEKKLAIQSVNNINNSELLLGFSNLRTGEHKIKLTNKNGNFDGEKIIVTDKYLNISFELTEDETYFFNVDSYGNFDDRFVIKVENGNTLSNNARVENEKSEIYFNDNTINFGNINSNDIQIKIYSILGEVLFEKTISSNENNILQLQESIFKSNTLIILITINQETVSRTIPMNMSSSQYIHF